MIFLFGIFYAKIILWTIYKKKVFWLNTLRLKKCAAGSASPLLTVKVSGLLVDLVSHCLLGWRVSSLKDYRKN
jgi:hypothetical protein